MRQTSVTSLFSIMLLTGITMGACSSQRSATNQRASVKRKIEKRSKPKTVQLLPFECPWDVTYRIYNKSKPKVYGAEYAKEQNKKLEPALD